jgi:hypothetical protein
MKVNKDMFEKVVYILFCIASFGALAVLRVAIREGIRQALKD